MKLRVLDLFSGLGGWSAAFRSRGHETYTVDIDERFTPDLVADILSLTSADLLHASKFDCFDVILASVPCEGFSVAAMGKSWEGRCECTRCGNPLVSISHRIWTHTDVSTDCKGYPRKNPDLTPKSETARLGLRLLEHTLYLIDELRPYWWWLENPRGAMRRMTTLQQIPRVTVTMCKYGKNYMKPTDLWGRWPNEWVPHPPCKNGDLCHDRAPRGSASGIQAIKDPAERALIPYPLSEQVCRACEQAAAQILNA